MENDEKNLNKISFDKEQADDKKRKIGALGAAALATGLGVASVGCDVHDAVISKAANMLIERGNISEAKSVLVKEREETLKEIKMREELLNEKKDRGTRSSDGVIGMAIPLSTHLNDLNAYKENLKRIDEALEKIMAKQDPVSNSVVIEMPKNMTPEKTEKMKADIDEAVRKIIEQNRSQN
jgi:hypothetical protein